MKYTVLLLRPDYMTDNYGQDTFMAHVDAPTPAAAVEAAQASALDADGSTTDPDDYHVLLCIAGHHDDLS